MDVVKSLPGNGHLATELDVRESAKVTKWIKDSAEKLGGLDGAANVAGVEREGGRHLADSRDEDWDFVMGINGAGVFYCMRAQLQQMLANGGGSIVSGQATHGVCFLVRRSAHSHLLGFRSMWRVLPHLLVSQTRESTMPASMRFEG